MSRNDSMPNTVQSLRMTRWLSSVSSILSLNMLRQNLNHTFTLRILLVIALGSIESAVIAQEKTPEPPLNAQSKQFVDSLAESTSPGFHEMPVADARKAFAGLDAQFGQGPIDLDVEDRKFAEVPVRIYRPKDTANNVLPVVLYFHGGGWVLGSIQTHDALCRRLCSESEAAVISVEYRLAPEHPYPAPLNDCYTALEFACQHATELRLDAKRIVVAGDSAGAGLAAAVAFKARNTSGPKLRAQVLIYPALDSDCSSKTYTSYAEGYGLSKAAMQWYWKQYVGSEPTKVYSSLSKAHSFRGLPETILITAQYDVLREEAELFAQKLKHAGVKVSYRRYDGVLHGFVHFAGAFDQGKTATTDIATQLKLILASE